MIKRLMGQCSKTLEVGDYTLPLQLMSQLCFCLTRELEKVEPHCPLDSQVHRPLECQ
jgi:hypothetical protein